MNRLLPQNLFSWLLPGSCVACKRRSMVRICPRCRTELIQLERTEPLALTQPLTVWAWGTYRGMVERGMHGLKYEQESAWGAVFGELMGVWWSAKPLLMQERTWQVVPIPLAPEKYASRGYNQAELIAQSFTRWTRYPHRPQLLTRTRNTEAQFKLNPQQRQANIQGAFVASPNVQGKAILLVDDICTTGATLGETANVLYAQGAARVAAVVVARPVFTPQNSKVK